MELPSPPWWNFFAGLPLWEQVLFWVALSIALTSVISAVTLAIAATISRRRNARLRETGNESHYLWVFLVAALNEEVTIADSVTRLREARATHKLIVVIDDGSDDATGDILRRLNGPDLLVMTRTAPQARIGKAAALNQAYRHLTSRVLNSGEYASWDADRIIVGIVDADGRLHPDAPAAAARRFTQPDVGGVQCLVHIYNVGGFLTWAQNTEFMMFGELFQTGRTLWGTANMGGNGQLNRLSALSDVADATGPWRDRLTEDQDLGVRMLQAGWRAAQENSVTIDQQGLSSLRRLYRQRTRWAQGAWQSMALLRGVGRARVGVLGRIDMVYYLLTPLLQLITGAGVAAALVNYLVRGVLFMPANLTLAFFFIALAFAPGLIALLHRARGVRGTILAILLSVPFLIYSWMLFPVVVHSLLRQLTGRTSWAKTAREAIADQAEPDGDSR